MAQVAPQFVMPAYLSSLTPAANRFRPVQLRSIEFDSINNNAQLLLDKGDAKSLNQNQLEADSRKLFQYFQIGLALPNSMFWVNLRPDSPDNIIDPYLEKTDLGKVLLEADLQLKKDLARFTNPDTAEGRQYWYKLYAKAEQIFGPEDMEIPTITRPWIVPGEIIIRASEKGAFIYKATLKVMLEQDYLKDSAFYNFSDPRQKELNSYSSQLIRELIIPKLTKEVNSSKRYAELRQVYYSLVLAQWYKQKNVIAGNIDPSLRGAEGDEATSSYAAQVDSRDLAGLTSMTKWDKGAYYQAYRRSFQDGEYKREERVKTSGGITVRQYSSGGMMLNSAAADGGSSFMVIQAQKLNPAENLVNTEEFVHMTMFSAGGRLGNFLLANLDAVAVHNGSGGTVADVHKIWTLLRSEDKGRAGELSMEFARQVAALLPTSSFLGGNSADALIDLLESRGKKAGDARLFVFVDRQGVSQGALRMQTDKRANIAALSDLGVSAAMRDKGIGSTLLDVFFMQVDEQKSEQASIDALPNAFGLYKLYLNRKGLFEPADYTLSFPADSPFGNIYWIPLRSIKKITNNILSARNDGGKAGGPETDVSYSPASPDDVFEYPADALTDDVAGIIWDLYKRIFPLATDRERFLRDLNGKILLIYREPDTGEITGYLKAELQPGKPDEIYIHHVAVSEYELDMNKPRKERAAALLLKFIRLMQDDKEKRLIITAASNKMKMVLEKMRVDGRSWESLPGKDSVPGRYDQAIKGDDYIFELGAKDGGARNFVERIEFAGKMVRIKGARDEFRSKTIANIFTGRLDPAREKENKEHGILFVQPAEVNGFSPEQCIEIAGELIQALKDPDIKEKMGIDREDFPGQALAKNFLIVEDTLVVIMPDGTLVAGKVESRGEIPQFIFRPRPSSSRSFPAHYYDENRQHIEKKLDKLKQDILAGHGSGTIAPAGKDGGVYEQAVADRLQKFMDLRDPAATSGKARVFSFDFDRDFIIKTNREKKEIFMVQVERFGDHLPIAIDKLLVRPGRGVDILIERLCQNAFDGIMSLADPSSPLGLSGSSPLELSGRRIAVYFDIRRETNGKKSVAISVEDNGAGKMATKTARKSSYVAQGIHESSPYIEWNDDWRQLSTDMVKNVNENARGWPAASQKEILADVPGQKNAFIFELPLESLVLTGLDSRDSADQSDGGIGQESGTSRDFLISEIRQMAGITGERRVDNLEELSEAQINEIYEQLLDKNVVIGNYEFKLKDIRDKFWEEYDELTKNDELSTMASKQDAQGIFKPADAVFPLSWEEKIALLEDEIFTQFIQVDEGSLRIRFGRMARRFASLFFIASFSVTPFAATMGAYHDPSYGLTSQAPTEEIRDIAPNSGTFYEYGIDDRLITANIKELSSLPNRFLGTVENRAAGEAVSSALQDYGYYEMRLNKTMPYLMHQELENGIPVYIAVVIPGRADTGKTVVISAHFDSAYAGADDNASGVAALLEIARVMRYSQPADTLYIVFTNGEEYGKIGAEVFSEEILAQGIEAENVIVLDIDSIGQSYAKTTGKKPQIVVTLAENTNTSFSIFDHLYGVNQTKFGSWQDSMKLTPGSKESDACTYAEHGFSAITVSSSSYAEAKDVRILNTNNDVFGAIEPEAVAGITEWLLKVIVGEENISEIVKNTVDRPLNIELDETAEEDFSQQMTEYFGEYGIDFTSNGDFKLSENGYHELKTWMEFVDNRLPQYKKYLTAIRYKRNSQGPSVVAQAYTATNSIDLNFPIEDYPLHDPFIKTQYNNESYFPFPVVWTHELAHIALEKELDGVPDVRFHTKMMAMGYTEYTFPYDWSLKELVATDMAYYLLYGKVVSKGYFPVRGVDVDLKATAPARQKFIEEVAKKIGVRDIPLYKPEDAINLSTRDGGSVTGDFLRLVMPLGKDYTKEEVAFLAKRLGYSSLELPEGISQEDLNILGANFKNAYVQRSLKEDSGTPVASVLKFINRDFLGKTSLSHFSAVLMIGLFGLMYLSGIASAAGTAMYGGSDWANPFDAFSLRSGNETGLTKLLLPPQSAVLEITKKTGTLDISPMVSDDEWSAEMHRQAQLTVERKAQRAEKAKEYAVLQSMLPDDASITQSVMDILEKDNPEVAEYLLKNNVDISCKLSFENIARAEVPAYRTGEAGEKQPYGITLYTHPSWYSPADSAAAVVRATEGFVKDATDDSLLLYELKENPAYSNGYEDIHSQIDPLVAQVFFPEDYSYRSATARFLMASGVEIRLAQTGQADMRSELIHDRGKETLIINELIVRSLEKKEQYELEMFIGGEVNHYVVEKLGGIDAFLEFDRTHRDTSKVIPPQDPKRTYEDYIRNRPIIMERYTNPAVQETALWLQIAEREDMDFIVAQNIPIKEGDIRFHLIPAAGAYSPWFWGAGYVVLSQDLKSDSLGEVLAHEFKHAQQSQDQTGSPLNFWIGVHQNFMFGGAAQMEREAHPHGELNGFILRNMQNSRPGIDVYNLSPEDVEALVRIRNRIAAEPWSYGRKALYDEQMEETLAGYYRIQYAVGWASLAIIDSYLISLLVGNVRRSLRSGILGNLAQLLRRQAKDHSRLLNGLVLEDSSFGKNQEDTEAQDGGTQKQDVAGVDFRGLPVGVQPSQAPVMMPQLEKLAQCSTMADMDKEWLGIQREMAGSSVPYEKIKEYIAVCLNKPDCKKHLNKAAACLISILKVEEEQAVPTRDELKDLLICLG